MEKKTFRRPHNYTEGLPSDGKKLREARMGANKSAPMVVDEIDLEDFTAADIYNMETGRTKRPFIGKMLLRHYSTNLEKQAFKLQKLRKVTR